MQRYASFYLVALAVPLIMADLLRHVLQDSGIWPASGPWSSAMYVPDVGACDADATCNAAPREGYGESSLASRALRQAPRAALMRRCARQASRRTGTATLARTRASAAAGCDASAPSALFSLCFAPMWEPPFSLLASCLG